MIQRKCIQTLLTDYLSQIPSNALSYFTFSFPSYIPSYVPSIPPSDLEELVKVGAGGKALLYTYVFYNQHTLLMFLKVIGAAAAAASAGNCVLNMSLRYNYFLDYF